MLKNILKVLMVFVVGMVGGIFSEQILWPYFVERPLFYKYRLSQNPIYVTEKKEVHIQENIALKTAIEKAEKIVVGIKSKTKSGKNLEGSGVILTSDGLLLTVAELAPQGTAINIFEEGVSDQGSAKGQILKRDVKNNLALIKIERENLSTVAFADLEKINLGERVFLMGIVFGKNNIQKIVNEGIVKNLDQNFINTNIFEKPVLTGSPLFNIEAQLVGLNVVASDGQVITIPISKIKEFTGM